jgi:hypothetical protein
MRFAFLILMLLSISLHVSADGKPDKRLDKLIVRAKVLEAKIDFSDEKMPRCALKIETTFTNEGDEPIIILQPVEEFDGFDDFIFSSGVNMFGKNENGNYLIQTSGALPSTCISCNEELRKLLDQKTPPDKYTKILKPKESFTFIDNSIFGMPLKTSSGIYGWDEIKINNWKIFGNISYSMFPINLEKYGRNFGQKLQKRWQKYGILYIRDTHSLITSEKFEIDLTDKQVL